jgi:phage anti-repressor protein
MFKTEKARELFSQLLDVNWKIDNKEYRSLEERVELNTQYRKLYDEIMVEMGTEEFTKFMEMGHKLFN